MRTSRNLVVETAVARTAGRISRLLGVGGGTTVPGKLLWKLDPGAIDRLAARLPAGCAVVSATNGKTTTASFAHRILETRYAIVANRAGANLVSGIASALVAARGAELGLFEVDEAALPEVAGRLRPGVVCLGNLFRDQLDRYGELELLAERWRAAVAALPEGARLVVNGDDPVVAELGAARRRLVYGLDDPSHSHPSLQHAADSTRCVACGTPYRYAAVYAGHLGDYRCPGCGHGRPALDVAARRIALRGLDGVDFDLETPAGSVRVQLALPGLYNVYNALAAATLAHALGFSVAEIAAGLEGAPPAFGRFERIAVGARTAVLLLVKNPTGANEVVRTLLAGGPPRVAVFALNDGIADGQDVSWIWDVDWEPLLGVLERVVVSGSRAAEIALRLVYGGYPRSQVEVEPDLARAFDRGLELVRDGEQLAVLPTYTAMLSLRGELARRGLVRPYWEQS